MNKVINTVVGVVALAALVVGVVAYNKAPTTIIGAQGAQGPVGPMAPQGPVGPKGADAPVRLGSISGPDSPYTYYGVNGVRIYPNTRDFTTSTTTVCAIQSPAATSTLISGGALFTTSSTTATTVTIAKSATAFATTTKLGEGAIAANAQGFLLASTTAITAGGTGSNLNPAYVFGPSQWFVVGVQGGVGTFSPVGQCSATFQAFE